MPHLAKRLLIPALIAAAFLGGVWFKGWQTSSTPVESERRPLYYACPMHPQYRADSPGDCPSCGMRLEAVFEDRHPDAPNATGLGLHLTGSQQQIGGVRLALVVRQAAHRTIRTTGRLVPDENRLHRINAATEMWIRKLYHPTTGTRVSKDEPLCGFYTTNFLTAAQSYLYILEATDRLNAAGQNGSAQTASNELQLRQAVELLQNLGVSDAQIREMEKTRKASALVDVRSPVAGYILSRKITLGQWLGPGTEMYEIADLSGLWIYADLFEDEARYVHPGMVVSVRAPNLQLSFTAKVSDAPPTFDEATRIMKVRLDAENPGLRLWPGMFVEVEFPLNLPAAMVIPVDAVIDSGMKKTVFVAKGNGYFEPRIVETGWRSGDQVEIVKGLTTGEQIVVSGNFLLDSESRMRMTAGQADQGTPGPGEIVVDPVCGMEVSPAKAAGRSEYKGKTYYFCSDHCKRKFDQNPEAVLSKRKS
jgi:Cu(I)/Ag(I) efflux system membrane fusion protein